MSCASRMLRILDLISLACLAGWWAVRCVTWMWPALKDNWLRLPFNHSEVRLKGNDTPHPNTGKHRDSRVSIYLNFLFFPFFSVSTTCRWSSTWVGRSRTQWSTSESMVLVMRQCTRYYSLFTCGGAKGAAWHRMAFTPPHILVAKFSLLNFYFFFVLFLNVATSHR